ncbi:MAG: hypothetical protein ACE5JQ_00705 [Candidatus Methylomirabilales bacterium]
MFGRVRQLPRWVPNWEAIRDQKVSEAQLQAEVELRQLEEERNLLVARQGEVAGELDRLGEPEANLRAHRTLARWWGVLFLLAAAVAILSAWWSLNWYLSLTWEKALLALTLFVLPLIGWMVFLLAARERLQGRDLWKIFCALGLLVVLCSVGATALLGAGRIVGTTLEEDLRQEAAVRQGDDLAASPEGSEARAQVSWVKSLLRLFGMVAIVLLGVAGEVAAGLAFHEYLKRMTVVWTVWPFYREYDDLAGLLVANVGSQEEVRRRPSLLYVRLTAEGMEQAAEAARQETEAQRAFEEAERRSGSLPFLIKRVVLLFGIALALLLGMAMLAFGDEARSHLTVVVIDRSTSEQADQEFSKNLRAVEGVLQRIRAGNSRLVVLGVTEKSFGASPLFVESAPRSAGRFGEYVEAWRGVAVQKWRQVTKALTPSARGSDLFGALARAAIEFDESPKARKRLILLSDMRQVGRGFNFERTTRGSTAVLGQVHRQGLIPRLDGVRVWVLGVHTAGVDERQWKGLKTFWTAYFKRAGAELQIFTPNRQLVEH